MFLEIENLTKSYDNKKVLKNISFSLEKGKILCLLGPSGCGKTTILNSIAGFVKIDSGKILLEKENITNLEPENRNISTVFQSYGLFNHKNVIENISYGLKFKKLNKKEILKKSLEMLDIIGLNGYERRKISSLSGGQKQRVAIARSLIVNPRLILLDEPFSNLDENLKESMRKEIKRVVNLFSMTTILVTHDQQDAFTIADKVILINNGNIIQNSTPKELYNEPNSKFSLEFVGKSNKISDNEFVRYENIKICENKKEQGVIKNIIFKGQTIEYEIETENKKVLNLIELNNNKERKIGDIVKLDIEIKKIK